MADVYKIVTDLILERLEQGEIPWKRPWVGQHRAPRNLSGHTYRGINFFLLECLGFPEPFFLTFNQAKKLGGNVKKGEKSCPVIFWKWLEVEEENEAGEQEKKRVPFARYYRVFNVLQCEGIEYPKEELPEREHSPIEAAEQIVAGYPNPPEIEYGKLQACYIPRLDKVEMPDPERFSSVEGFYSVLMHELTHSAFSDSRLGSKAAEKAARHGSFDYGVNELQAEFGAAYLCAHASIDNSATVENSAAYIQGWSNAIKADRRLVVMSACAAQRAADHILGITYDDNDK